MNQKLKISIVTTLSLIGIIALFMQPSIPQSLQYHCFADSDNIGNIPNYKNVASNFFFIIIGLIGIFSLYKNKFPTISESLKLNYYLFFIGITLTGFGSSYYHAQPNNYTLVYDRLPMTISFMSFFTVIIGEYISEALGKKSLIPFLCLGLFSVLYWYYTELQQQGDLRPYILIQFLPMLLIPTIVLIYPSNYKNLSYLWFIMLTYALAKLFEGLDEQVFTTLKIISGHSIKHLLASCAPLCLLIGLKKRKFKYEAQ